MPAQPATSFDHFRFAAGLLCSTALTLTLVAMGPGAVLAQNLVYDENAGPTGNDWNIGGDANWRLNGSSVPYTDGADVFFLGAGAPYTVDITQDVAPQSVFFLDDLLGIRTLTGAGGSLSTANGLNGALPFVVLDSTVVLNADIIGPNALIFALDPAGVVDLTSTITVDTTVTGGVLNNLAGGALQGATTILDDGVVDAEGGAFSTVDVQTDGTLNVTADTVADVTVSGGQGNIDADLTGTLAVSDGVADVSAVVSGTTTVTGGTLNNETGGDLQGATTISGTGVVDAEGGAFSTVDVQTGGTLNVTAETVADVTVSGGQGNIDAGLTGTLSVSDGIADVSAAVSGATTVTGGVLNNETGGDLQGATTISGTGTVDAEGGDFSTVDVQTGGTLNVTAETDADVTVSGGQGNIDGDLTGTLSVSDGVADVSAAVSGATTVTGGVLNNETGGDLQGVTTISGTGTVDAEGGDFSTVDVQTGGTLNVTAATVADVTVSGGQGNIDANLAGTLSVSDGVADVSAAVSGATTVTGGVLNNETGGDLRGVTTISGTGTVDAEGGDFSTVDVQTGGTLNVTAATVADVTVSGGQGNIDANLAGTLSVSDGVADVSAAVSGATTVTGGVLNNETGGDLQGATTISGTGTVDAEGGDFSTVDVQTGGTLNVTAETNADVTVSGGQGNIDADLTGTLDVTDGIADVSAAVSGATTVTGGTLNNETGGSLQGVILSSNGTLNLNGGTSASLGLNGGTLNINAAVTNNIVNNGTDIQINPLGGTGSVTGTIDNVLGSLTTYDGATVSGLVTNRAGGVLVSEGGTYQSGILVEGGDATINGATTLGTTGSPATLTNEAGTVTLNADVAGNLTNTGPGITTNNATLDGDLSVSGGRFIQNGPVSSAGVTGDVTITAGTLEAAGGTFDQPIDNALAGDIEVTGTSVLDITNSGTGDVTITTTGDMTGTLRNDTANGRFDINGRLNGDLIVTDGAGIIRGTVEDNVTLNGGVTALDGAAARINGTTTVNTATLNANAGTFAGDVRLNAGAAMNVTGAVSGDVTNIAGDLSVTNAGDLTGTIDQSGGTTSISGTLSGNASVDGGTFTTQAGSTVTQDINVDGGAFIGNGGTIAGGLDVAGGTADITGALTTDVTTTGGITTNTGTLGGSADVNGGSFISQTGSNVLEDVTVDGGAFLGNGGAIAGGLDVLDGTADITGALTTDVTAAGGATTNTGTLIGDVVSTGGTFANANQITGTLDVNGGTVTQTAGVVAGQTTVTAGQLTALGGGFDAGITNTGGQVAVRGPVSADVINTNGQLLLDANAGLTGDVSNADTMRLFGEMSGDLLNTGTVDAAGTITGAVTNAAGAFTVADGAVAMVTNGITNAPAATLDLSGALTADVSNAAGGAFMLDGATLTGDIANFGDMQTAGTVTVSGTTQNASTLDIQTGNLVVDTALTNVDGGTVNIASGATLEAQNAVNQSDGLIVNNGTLTGVLDNAGMIQTANGTFNGGVVQNSGQIGGGSVGALRFEDGLSNTGTVDLAANGTPGDTVLVGGAGLSGDGTFALDIDLTTDTGGQSASDSITVSTDGAVTGDVALAFNVLGIGGQQEDDILVLDVDESVANSFNVTATGLPDPGDAVIYTLVQEESDSDVYVVDLLNPGIGALAGSIVLTQSLIGSVINRPSSPFVNGLAYEDEDPCGFGGWARLTGGSADTNGLIIQTGANERAVRGEISADFYGLQMGSDFGCFNGHFNGWDLASGGIIGFNEGRSTQPIFALTEAAGLSDRITSFTEVDFFQSYAGVYGTAVRDRFAAELQYRVEQTDFTANNEGVNGSIGLGLTDSQFDSNSSTVSGSLSYALDIPETGLTFVPVAGFAYTQVATDPIPFEDGSIVQVEDFDSRIGFIGGTISRTQFGADGVSAFNQFVTATYYKDFADDPASVFTSGDGLETRSVTTENLGAYTEVSIGLNYIKILEVGNGLNAKQLSASARADWRASDQLDSWGITAQVRLQF